MDQLGFRQIHLDFHNSGLLRGIGSRFDKAQFQQALIKGHVNAINLFAKCHHGYSYHFTKVNEMHPGLDFDLLAAQLEACKEIGVATQVYISCGLDEKEAVRHPEWLMRARDESTVGAPDFDTPGYHLMCYNTPYMDLLAAQVAEVMEMFSPEGIWLDISSVRVCYCWKCREDLRAAGKRADDPDAVRELGERVYAAYTRRIREVVDRYDPACRIFHNAGHITRGRRDLADMNTHLEAESLPTGGYGYDHFPLTAAYMKTLDKEYIGMTGKFHTAWGEFGGFKHPNALRYEAALSLAMGAKCCVGDQLHPLGAMDMATYELIGAAYGEMEPKEAYCGNVTALSDIAVLSVEAAMRKVTGFAETPLSDVGVNRILLEGKYLYSFIDEMEDFGKYKLIILPDCIRLSDALSDKIQSFLSGGGKLLLSGASGLREGEDEFAPFIKLRYKGQNPYTPSYMRPLIKLKTNNDAAFVMYSACHMVESAEGEEAAVIENPYFNRTAHAFSSHQHTPNNPERVGSAAILGGNCAYIAHEIFQEYAQMGSLHLKELACALIDALLGDSKTLMVDLPDKAIVTLNAQQAENRLILHVLFAHTTLRGRKTEVIEDTVPLHNVKVRIQPNARIREALLVPQNQALPIIQNAEGICEIVIPRVDIHQMVVFGLLT